MNSKLTIMFIMLFSFTIYADDFKYSISGKIFFNYEKPIHIFLVDEETSKKPFIGIDKLIIMPNKKDISNGYTSYQFTNVKKGIYGIRCFQDMNDNQQLDKGLFGPSEPWGLSWNENKTSKWPSFDNFCFELSNDTNTIDIKLNK